MSTIYKLSAALVITVGAVALILRVTSKISASKQSPARDASPATVDETPPVVVVPDVEVIPQVIEDFDYDKSAVERDISQRHQQASEIIQEAISNIHDNQVTFTNDVDSNARKSDAIAKGLKDLLK